MISIRITGALLTLLPAIFLAGPASAQEGETADNPKMVERRDAKLKEPFFQNADWITDYDKARAVAKKQGKLIFAYFTRSYSY